MFSGHVGRVKAGVENIRKVLRTHESMRTALLSPGTPDANNSEAVVELWQKPAVEYPTRTDWHIFDHCAAITRLYAMLEQFVDDLVTDYLRIVPSLYERYQELPLAVRVQHRVAVGQILHKWSEDGPHGALTELGIVKGLAEGLRGTIPYTLLADAFLIDPHNYRAATLRKIFGDLGFANCWPAVEKYAPMAKFIQESRGSTETAESILHDIIEYRNQASHTNVTDVLSIEEILSYANFVVHVCESLARMLKTAVLRRRFEMNQMVKVATVIKVCGRVIGVLTEPGCIAVGDELLFRRHESFLWGRVKSVQKCDVIHDRYESIVAEELGIQLDCKMREGEQLFRSSDWWDGGTGDPIESVDGDVIGHA